MIRVIKSQLYNLFCGNTLLIALGSFVFLVIMEFISEMSQVELFGINLFTGSEIIGRVEYYGDLILFAGFVMCHVFGKDMRYNTISVELSSGVSRRKAFFGRYLAGITIVLLCGLFITFVFVIPYTINNGWGDYIEAKDMLVRTGLYILFFIRICSEAALISSIFKSTSASMTVFSIIWFAEGMILTFAYEAGRIVEEKLIYFAIPSPSEILQPAITETYVEGQGIVTDILSAIPLETIKELLQINIIIIFSSVILAYLIFRRRDLK